ncbi:PAS domain S-box protein [Halovenus rubra]|uniref:histidine kinase n=2 Tax=Halovenus rubra TaxID=869890 RepID=A0ABD5X195_9EURY|nr:PAS domain S-box protein [Halovenus rubra]
MTAEGHSGQTPDASQYKPIVDSISEVAYLLDSDQDLCYTNQSSLQHPAVSLETVRGGHIMDLVEQIATDDEGPTKFEQALETVYNETAKTEFPVKVELDVSLQTGTATREYRFSPCETGTATGAVIVAGEKTERSEPEPEWDEQFFDEAPDPMFVQDEFGKFTDVNEKAAEKLGYSRAELLEMEAAEIDANVDQDDAQELLSKVKSNGQTIEIEGRHQCSDGSTYPVDVRVTPLETDEKDRFLSHARDITERKEREQRLKKLQERLDLAVDGAGIGVWDWDIETDEVIFNEAWASMLGYRRDELEFDFQIWEQLVHPTDLETATAALEAHMRGESEFYESEIRMQTKSGNWKWVWTTGQVVERDDDGEPTRAAGIHIDIDDRKQAELDVKRSERQFGAVFNDPQMLVGVLDTEGVVQRVNKTAVDSVPATREQIEGILFSETPWWNHDTALQNDVEQWIDRAVAGEYVEFESEHSLGDGERIIVSGSFRPVRDDDGEVVSVVASSRDITERRERERELREAKHRLDLALAGTETGVWEWNIETDELTWTESMKQLFGLEPGTFEGTLEAFAKRVHPEDRPGVERALETAAENDELYETEYRIQRDDGEQRWGYASGEVVEGDGPQKMVGIVTDITGQKRRERQLEMINEALEKLSYAKTTEEVAESVVDIANESLGVPLVAVSRYDDDSDKLVPWAATGQVLEQTGGDALDSLPAIPSGTEEMAVFRSGESKLVENYQLLDEAGAPGEPLRGCVMVPIGKFGMLIVASMQPDSFDSTDEDLISIIASNAEAAFERATREQALETYKDKLEESNKNLQEFAYIASHDLQEPLRSVTSYLALLESEYHDEIDQEGQFYIERAEDNASRMSSMISALLQYSRVESQGGEFVEVDTTEVVEKTLDGLGVLIDESGTDIDYDSLPRVTADKDQLGQVFQNLVKNAINHGGSPPEVDIHCKDIGDAWQFSVSDNGPGVPEAQQDRIFEIFQQATDKGDDSGESGIGLAICERIVSRHHGDIWVESDANGSRFNFTLPKRYTR